MNNPISNNLKVLRKYYGYTQDSFSQKLQIKRSSLGAYEEGRAMPDVFLLYKICQVFNITIEKMITEEFYIANELKIVSKKNEV